MSAGEARPKVAYLSVVPRETATLWGSIKPGPLTRASIAVAAEFSREDGVLLDALEIMTCAAMRAAQLFPDWAEAALRGREDLIDDVARLLVATNLRDGYWPGGAGTIPAPGDGA